MPKLPMDKTFPEPFSKLRDSQKEFAKAPFYAHALFAEVPWYPAAQEWALEAAEAPQERRAAIPTPEAVKQAPRPVKQGVRLLVVGDYPRPNGNTEVEELLTKMLGAMKLRPDQIARTLALSAEGADQAALEDAQMRLYAEIRKHSPEVVVSLGALATNLLLGRQERLSQVHGQILPREVLAEDGPLNFALVPLFHPEFLLINPNMKRTAWIDMQKIMVHLGLS